MSYPDFSNWTKESLIGYAHFRGVVKDDQLKAYLSGQNQLTAFGAGGIASGKYEEQPFESTAR